MADSKYKPLVQDEVPQAVGVVNSQPLFVPVSLNPYDQCSTVIDCSLIHWIVQPVVETIPTDTFTNHMSLALYTCIFCCWPLGMVAMAYSHMVGCRRLNHSFIFIQCLSCLGFTELWIGQLSWRSTSGFHFKAAQYSRNCFRSTVSYRCYYCLYCLNELIETRHLGNWRRPDCSKLQYGCRDRDLDCTSILINVTFTERHYDKILFGFSSI
jgi:hypothetical protein